MARDEAAAGTVSSIIAWCSGFVCSRMGASALEGCSSTVSDIATGATSVPEPAPDGRRAILGDCLSEYGDGCDGKTGGGMSRCHSSSALLPAASRAGDAVNAATCGASAATLPLRDAASLSSGPAACTCTTLPSDASTAAVVPKSPERRPANGPLRTHDGNRSTAADDDGGTGSCRLAGRPWAGSLDRDLERAAGTADDGFATPSDCPATAFGWNTTRC